MSPAGRLEGKVCVITGAAGGIGAAAAAAALLREAQAFVKLNDRIDARLTLQKLVADHAGTPQASAADTMMKDLATD